jgi:hypothetical protein
MLAPPVASRVADCSTISHGAKAMQPSWTSCAGRRGCRCG